MNRLVVIGLTGPAGAGKDTVADLLCTHARFCKLSFADTLRAEVCDAFGVTIDALTRRETKETPSPVFAIERCLDNGFVGAMVTSYKAAQPSHTIEDLLSAPRSPRDIMRWWGTEYRRAENEHYWTRALSSRMRERHDGGQARFVVTDVRFENEAETIRRHGGRIWQVKRPGLVLDTSHVSEVDGSAFRPHACINNMHDVRHLQHIVLAEWIQDDTRLSTEELIAMGQTLAIATV